MNDFLHTGFCRTGVEQGGKSLSKVDAIIVKNTDRLLLSCATAELQSSLLLGQIERGIAWDHLIRKGEEHRLLPLLYKVLNDHCAEAVPEAVLESLRRVYYLNAGNNLQQTGELLRVLSLLETAGIPVVPFKGPVLAESAYGNISLRQFGDLDILVPLSDLQPAKQLLINDGYQPEFRLDARRETAYIQSEHAFQFQKGGGKFVLELHWRFGSRDNLFPAELGRVWSRLTRRRFQGREINALSPEDLFLYLCLHGAKHYWERLEWICCLTRVALVEKGLDWVKVAQRAKSMGIERAFRLGLLLATNLSALKVPVPVNDQILSDQVTVALATQVWGHMFVPEQEHTKREVYRHKFYIQTRERWRDRAGIVFFLSARIPHPLSKDWDVIRLPERLSFLYYLVRPIRLFFEFGTRRFTAMLRPKSTDRGADRNE